MAAKLPENYDGSYPLTNDRHEKFAQAMATGAVTQAKAVQAAYGPRKSAAQLANNLLRRSEVKARVDFLRREKAADWQDEDDVTFEGFEKLLTKVLDDISELVRLCELNGLAREAASARDALTTISSRILTQLESLRAADATRMAQESSRLIELLDVWVARIQKGVAHVRP